MKTRNNGTRETMPMHIWMHEVICAAGCTVEEAEPHRARLTLWANTGEPVWMAADGLKMFIEAARVRARVEADDPIRLWRK